MNSPSRQAKKPRLQQFFASRLPGDQPTRAVPEDGLRASQTVQCPIWRSHVGPVNVVAKSAYSPDAVCASSYYFNSKKLLFFSASGVQAVKTPVPCSTRLLPKNAVQSRSRQRMGMHSPVNESFASARAVCRRVATVKRPTVKNACIGLHRPALDGPGTPRVGPLCSMGHPARQPPCRRRPAAWLAPLKAVRKSRP